MKLFKVQFAVLVVLFILQCCQHADSQETPFELPVQLVGFPVIIMTVRLTNFLKKLRYSLSPDTYRSRTRRELTFPLQSDEIDVPYDAQDVEKYIIGEFGTRACVFERVCAQYAARAQVNPRPQMDWTDVFRQYRQSPDQAKEFYLLSVFLGDIVASPYLCHQLGKRRGCDDNLLQ